MAVTEPCEGPMAVGALVQRVRGALARAFPDDPWVRGEVHSVRVRNGHCWFELVEAGGGHHGRDAVLPVVCWERRWRRISAELQSCGVALADGVVLTVRGAVRFWDRGGKVQLDLTEVDVHALVGALAQRRAEVRARLEAEGIFDANRHRPSPPMPLRVGLVASVGTEGYRDFVGVLERSGYAFEITVVDSRVQGPGAPDQLAAAVERIAPGCDVVALVRGGGSGTDLIAFDDERVVRAVVGTPVPVLAGIGHTGDRSLLDEVAWGAFPTPTACAQALVGAVDRWCERVDAVVTRIGTVSARLVEDAGRDLAHRRDSLDRAARHGLAVQGGHLDRQRRAVDASARRTLERAAASVRSRAATARTAGRTQVRTTAQHLHGRVVATRRAAQRSSSAAAASLADRRSRLAGDRLRGLLDHRAGALVARRAALSAFDPQRQLARGWSVVRDPHGRALRDVGGVVAGDRIRIELARGALGATVEDVVRPGEDPT